MGHGRLESHEVGRETHGKAGVMKIVVGSRGGISFLVECRWIRCRQTLKVYVVKRKSRTTRKLPPSVRIITKLEFLIFLPHISHQTGLSHNVYLSVSPWDPADLPLYPETHTNYPKEGKNH